MNFYRKKYKNSYLIKLKNSNFFGRDSYNIINFSAKFYSKI